MDDLKIINSTCHDCISFILNDKQYLFMKKKTYPFIVVSPKYYPLNALENIELYKIAYPTLKKYIQDSKNNSFYNLSENNKLKYLKIEPQNDFFFFDVFNDIAVQNPINISKFIKVKNIWNEELVKKITFSHILKDVDSISIEQPLDVFYNQYQLEQIALLPIKHASFKPLLRLEISSPFQRINYISIMFIFCDYFNTKIEILNETTLQYTISKNYHKNSLIYLKNIIKLLNNTKKNLLTVENEDSITFFLTTNLTILNTLSWEINFIIGMRNRVDFL